MWRTNRSRQRAAADAIVAVVHESVLSMRAMAHTHDAMCDDIFPGMTYQEQIRELADVCDNLVPGLRPGGPRRPLDALQFTWDNRSAAQQQWIRRCLADRGFTVEELINTAPDRRRIQPN